MKVETHSTCRLSDKSLSPIHPVCIQQNIRTSEGADRSRKIRLCIRVLELQDYHRLQLEIEKKINRFAKTVVFAGGFTFHEETSGSKKLPFQWQVEKIIINLTGASIDGEEDAFQVFHFAYAV